MMWNVGGKPAMGSLYQLMKLQAPATRHRLGDFAQRALGQFDGLPVSGNACQSGPLVWAGLKGT